MILSGLSLLAVGLAGEEACDPSGMPADWHYEVAWVSGRQGAEARQEAFESAKQTLGDQLCAGFSQYGPEVCTRIRASIRRAGDGVQRRSACAIASAPRSVVNSLVTGDRKLDQALDGLARDIARRAADSPVLLSSSWGSGCAAPRIGRVLELKLQTHLGSEVHLVREPGREVTEVLIELIATRLQVEAAVTLQPPGGVGATSLGGFVFPRELFGVPEDERGDCFHDHDVALHSGQRAGREGLQVRIDIVTDAGQLCEGAQFRPTLEVSSPPALVQLWSVDTNGTGYLVWPPRGGYARVTQRRNLGVFDVARSPAGGDELLVAIALPEDADPEPGASWRAPCLLPGTFGQALIPEDAAVGISTFSIVPAGEGGCPAATSIDPAELARIISATPVCVSP